MKFTCDRLQLAEAVNNVQRAVSSKTTVPALEGVLLKTDHQKLTLCGYDLELCIITSIDASIIQEGASVLKAKLFSEILRKLPENTITIEINEKDIVYITCGRAEYKIIGIPAADYPEIPIIRSSDKLTLEGETLSSMIRQTLYAVSDSDSKPTNKGSLFEIENNQIRIVSVDGFRMAIRTEKIAYEGELSFIVPGKHLAEVMKLIGEDTKEVQMFSNGRHISFTIGNYTVMTKLIVGDFMNYRSSIPTHHSARLTVNTRKFIDTIERMSLLLTDKMKSPIRCYIDNNLIKTTCNTPLGQAADEVEVIMEGEALEIGFNNRFLLDAFRYTETDEVIVELGGPISPMVLKPIEGDSFLFMLLPMRLSR